MKDKRVRRARALVCYWEADDFVICNYLTNGQVVASPAVIRVLDATAEPLGLKKLISLLCFLPRAEEVVECLRSETILLVDGSCTDRFDRRVDEAWVWGHDARLFHYGTRHIKFTFNPAKIRTLFEKKAIRFPPPSPFMSYDGPHIQLPELRDQGNRTDFWSILAKRRTCRTFNRTKTLNLLIFSNLLKTVCGFTRFYNESHLDQRIVKTSPSGGARHPLESYLLIRNVEGIKKGVYHYECRTHRLTRRGNLPNEQTIIKAFAGQHWISDAAAIFVFVAVLQRSMWKYEHSRAYRVVTLDAGHLGQTFQLVGTALGLGVFCTAAFDDRMIEGIVGVDGVSQVVIYGGAAGYNSGENSRR